MPEAGPAGGLHVAIIMDGNGRWAMKRGLPRLAGHRAGGESVRRVVEAAPGLGIATLSLFAFSCDNWRRPAEEVGGLMRLLRSYLRREAPRLVEAGIRLTVIGRRDRLPPPLRRGIARAERLTRDGSRLHLRIALDYSARESIARAARRTLLLPVTIEAFGEAIERALIEETQAGAVDLLIRTGGEKRLSDFLLWESAYAELWFTERMWPEFDAGDLEAAVIEFGRRERRFGGLPLPAAASAPAGAAS